MSPLLPEILAVLLALATGVAGLLGLLRLFADWQRERQLVFLQVLLPKKESKTDKEISSEQFSTGKTFKDVVGVMDHLFQSLYGLYDSHKLRRLFRGQPFFSVEYAALEGEILFFVVVPRPYFSFFEKQIT